jgi:hypothetical protein
MRLFDGIATGSFRLIQVRVPNSGALLVIVDARPKSLV